MTDSALIIAAASWVVVGVVFTWFHRPPPHRLRALGTGVSEHPVLALGSLVRRLFGRPHGDRALDAQVGWALLSALAGSVLFGVVGLGLAPLSWAVSVHRRRRDLRRREATLTAELPDVIELVSLGLRSGLSVRATIEVVVPHLDGTLTDALRDAVAHASEGGSLAEALTAIPRLDPRLRPFIGLLVASLRDGDSIVDGLDRLAADARADERRHNEEHARRLPVTMLLPLVFGVLPAFVLLTIVPVVSAGVVSLRLP